MHFKWKDPFLASDPEGGRGFNTPRREDVMIGLSSCVQVSGFSQAAGQKTAGQIDKETLKKQISNVE